MMASIEEILLQRAHPHVQATRTQRLMHLEERKGCEPTISPTPPCTGTRIQADSKRRLATGSAAGHCQKLPRGTRLRPVRAVAHMGITGPTMRVGSI